MKILAYSGMLLLATSTAWAASPFAVVKSLTGQVRTSITQGTYQDVKVADLLPNGSQIETGPESKISLRLQADQSNIDLREKTKIKMKWIKRDGKVIRKLIVDRGNLYANFKRKGDGGILENAQTVAQIKTARFSFSSDDQAVATFIVLEGELTVINRPKDKTALVHGGQKAVSDLNGIQVTDASDSELEAVGLHENSLELDFQNPETDEVSTLELDYETHY
jgi:ferric-dicitrate binding protein FerR (iron transport regulator)